MRTESIKALQTQVKRSLIVVGVFAMLSAIATTAVAQEQSLKPGINDKYKAPDVQKSVKSFEGESREIYAKREQIADLLNLKPGMDVADIGAGTGFFSRLMAKRVAPEGTVYGVDISENFIEHMKKTAKEEGITNMKVVMCDEKSTHLDAESVDVVFICDTYHHFEYPYETLKSIHQALRPGGLLLIVDFERVKGITSESRCKHVRCGKGTVTDEVKDSGFDYVDEVPMLKDQWIRRYKKRAPAKAKKAKARARR